MELSEKARTRYWSHVERTATCWLWIARKNESGYGIFVQQKSPLIQKYAHRVAWSLANGPIPDRACVLHRCDVRLCVNPEHLFLGTRRENSADMVAKGRSGRGESHSQAILTEAQVRVIRAARNVPSAELAAAFGVSPSMIRQIWTGARWKHVA